MNGGSTKVEWVMGARVCMVCMVNCWVYETQLINLQFTKHDVNIRIKVSK